MTGNIYNVPMDPDPVYQKRLEEIRTTPDMAKRTELIKETGIYLLKTYNNLPLVTPNQYSIWQPSVKGYHGECALGTMNYAGIWARIWVDR
jgi:ABC-type transport system substrate-binding protein